MLQITVEIINRASSELACLMNATPKSKQQSWGWNEKDWTQHTDLHQWLAKKPIAGVSYLYGFIQEIRDGASLQEIESLLPQDYVTDFYWHAKLQLEVLSGKTSPMGTGRLPTIRRL
jgi:hypothetical protein